MTTDVNIIEVTTTSQDLPINEPYITVHTNPNPNNSSISVIMADIQLYTPAPEGRAYTKHRVWCRLKDLIKVESGLTFEKEFPRIVQYARDNRIKWILLWNNFKENAA